LTVYNNTHLQITQIDETGALVDDFTIVQTQHGPFGSVELQELPEKFVSLLGELGRTDGHLNNHIKRGSARH